MTSVVAVVEWGRLLMHHKRMLWAAEAVKARDKAMGRQSHTNVHLSLFAPSHPSNGQSHVDVGRLLGSRAAEPHVKVEPHPQPLQKWAVALALSHGWKWFLSGSFVAARANKLITT